MAPPVELIRSVLKQRSGFWITCNGASMEPTIRMSEKVWVRNAKPKTGDVVVFESKTGELILHRVTLWPVVGPWFWHMGDAPSPRGPRRVKKQSLLGVADVPCKKQSILPLFRKFPTWKIRELRARMGIL